MDNQNRIPTSRPFWVQEETKEMLTGAVLASREHPVNILVTGKQGCGKTELGRQLAARLRRPYFLFQMGLVAEAGQLFGTQIARNGSTMFQPSLFIIAVETPQAIIGLDEINRTEHPRDANGLFNLLDDSRATYIAELGRDVVVAPGVIFLAAINEGMQFTGAGVLDSALRDRFYTVQLGYPPVPAEIEILTKRMGIPEEEASVIVNCVTTLRMQDIDVSVRQSLMVAEMLKMGLSVEDAFTFILQVHRDVVERILLTLHFAEQEGDTERNKTWAEL